jgi:hypothetical protein
MGDASPQIPNTGENAIRRVAYFICWLPLSELVVGDAVDKMTNAEQQNAHCKRQCSSQDDAKRGSSHGML